MGFFSKPTGNDMSKQREKPSGPFKYPRDPRPKGAQKGVVRRDNGRGSRYSGARDPFKKK